MYQEESEGGVRDMVLNACVSSSEVIACPAGHVGEVVLRCAHYGELVVGGLCEGGCVGGRGGGGPRMEEEFQ